MNVDDAASTGRQASLDQSVVFCEVILIESTGKDIVGKELPADWQTKYVEAVIVHEVLHLTSTVMSIVSE